MESNEKIDGIRKRISKKEPEYSISRIPDKVRKEFTEFANKEFCSDRGMALKFLWDFYTGVISTGTEHLEIELSVQKERQNSFDERLKKLETTEEKPNKKKRLG